MSHILLHTIWKLVLGAIGMGDGNVGAYEIVCSHPDVTHMSHGCKRVTSREKYCSALNQRGARRLSGKKILCAVSLSLGTERMAINTTVTPMARVCVRTRVCVLDLPSYFLAAHGASGDVYSVKISSKIEESNIIDGRERRARTLQFISIRQASGTLPRSYLNEIFWAIILRFGSFALSDSTER